MCLLSIENQASSIEYQIFYYLCNQFMLFNILTVFIRVLKSGKFHDGLNKSKTPREKREFLLI